MNYTKRGNLTDSFVLFESVEAEISFAGVLRPLDIKKIAIDTATPKIPTSNKLPSVRFNWIADRGAGAGVLIQLKSINNEVIDERHTFHVF